MPLRWEMAKISPRRLWSTARRLVAVRFKLADVMTGLDIEVTAASGLQCEAPSATNMAVATIKFVEGFNSAIRAVADDAQTADVDDPRETAASC